MRGGDQAMYLGTPTLTAPHWFARHARALTIPLALLFWCSHAALFMNATGAVTSSAFAAVSLMTVRHSLGGEFWGFDGPSSVGIRTLTAIAAPLLLLTWAWPLLLLHPTTLYRWLSRPDDAHPEIAREAVLFRFGYLFEPEWREIGSVALHMALPVAVYLWAGAPMWREAVLIVNVALWGSWLVKHFGWWQEIQLLRSLRYVYPILGLGFATLYATTSLWVSVPVFVASLVPPAVVLRRLGPFLGLTEPPAHCPGDDAVHGAWFKAGALAYLQGTGPLVRWYWARPA